MDRERALMSTLVLRVSWRCTFEMCGLEDMSSMIAVEVIAFETKASSVSIANAFKIPIL